MSKKTQNQEEKALDNISSSRYISHMSQKSQNFRPPPIKTVYLGSRGILFQVDCLDLLANMLEGSVDMIFVDPPFNLGKDYDVPNFNDNMETEAYRSWCRSWLIELVRVLRPGGALFLYHMPKWLMDLGAWLNTLPVLTYKSWIAMKMKNGFPIKNRVHPAHYGILYYVKNGAKPTFNVVRHKTPVCRHCGKLIRDYGGYRKKFDRFEDDEGIPWIQISDFWEDTRPARQDKTRKNSINELPLHIPERVMLMSTNPGDVILDCFAGGGSTLHTAQVHDRYWIGGEIGDTSSILQRIATFFGTDERQTLPNRLTGCFAPGFKQAFLSNHNNKSKTRPIITVDSISDAAKSIYQDINKSKVLGF